jgi:hypothetical protein
MQQIAQSRNIRAARHIPTLARATLNDVSARVARRARLATSINSWRAFGPRHSSTRHDARSRALVWKQGLKFTKAHS